jgi:hypothetical protein
LVKLYTEAVMSSELCTSLPPGGGEVRTYVWQEWKKTRTYWETRPW